MNEPPAQRKTCTARCTWRRSGKFLTWLGSQTAALQAGLSLLNQHDPANDLHRFAGAVAPHKYRSSERRDRLATARRLLHLIDCWDRTFAERFFPRFATRSGVP